MRERTNESWYTMHSADMLQRRMFTDVLNLRTFKKITLHLT